MQSPVPVKWELRFGVRKRQGRFGVNCLKKRQKAIRSAGEC